MGLFTVRQAPLYPVDDLPRLQVIHEPRIENVGTDAHQDIE